VSKVGQSSDGRSAGTTPDLRSRQPLLPLLRRIREVRGTAVAIAAAVAAAAGLGVVGADSRWVAALGESIVTERGIPNGVPYASAPTDGWHNVLVAAELIFHWLDQLGPRGLLAAQVAAVGSAFVLLAAGARREGARDSSIAVVLLLVAVGALTSLVVLRLQLFSLAFFPGLLLLIRRELRAPSGWIWLVPPLLAIWGNLHGGVLLGYAVLSGYLVFARAREHLRTAALVWLASTLALLATPSLLETIDYYRGVLSNEAAKRGVGLWAPLTLESPFDVVFIATAFVLLVLAARARPQVWELVVIAGLAFLTLRTARSGVWLLFMLAAPAARGLNVRRTLPSTAAVGLAATLIVAGTLGLVRGPASTGAGERVLAAALDAADGTPILAQDVLAEQVALAGGRIWVGNPLDAFSHADQRLYLDWHEGDSAGDAALAHAPRVVMVHPDSDSERRLRAQQRLRVLARDENAVVYGR
jgi:hypothetical protein